MAIVLFASFVLLLIFAFPVAYALGLSSVAAMAYQGGIPLTILAQRMFTGLDSFPLLAVPFFILAGGLMETGGMSIRLIQLANVIVGHFRGGLGQVVILATMMFSGLSGSSAADTAAIGSIMIPSMVRKGYPRGLATAVVAASGGFAVLIPPAITMIVYGVTANVSIGWMFFAGFGPAAVMGVGMMVTMYVIAGRMDLPMEPRATCGGVWQAFVHAILPLLMPVMVLGGIRAGVFTPTEGAIVAVVYAALLSLILYRELKISDLPRILVTTVKLTGIVTLLIGMSSTFAWVVASQRIPQLVTQSMLGISEEPWIFLFMVNILFLFVGTIMDPTPAIIILVPILYPVASRLGIDPIHFGTVLVANLGIGMVTPPVGVVLYIAASVGKTTIEEVTKHLLPFFAALILVLLVFTYFPDVTLFVPRLFGYEK
ncbi:MAG TPA: TRAP transporter large permease [Chloroflexota bacterium]|nr:TRAP transporter large permease [Chloroflexota bacterium]